MKNHLFEKLENTIENLDITTISEERKQELQILIDYLQSKKEVGLAIRLNFICTHNSRRSHLSQVWAQTLAAYYNVPNVNCYSGGTEATALFPVVAKTLDNQGFKISALSEGSNPVYSIKFSKNEPAVIGFSKQFSNAFNPQSEFAAIMTCSSADKGCPLVNGCDKRIAIMYQDPKVSDNTPQQAATYLERSLQIATEMKFVFAKVK
jgi:arsenate reductase